ncbi:hypothetical protein [Flexivirga alba]|uniref:Uncharacterized protein n=1 Tax=Flexivirga alba TaxID=702742 RepID=A0ABW2AHB7_9MICO
MSPIIASGAGPRRSRRTANAWRAADRVGALLEKARREPLAPPTIDAERAQELVASVQRGRDAR